MNGLFGHDVDPDARLPGADEDGIIRPDAVDRPRSHPGDQAEDAVLAPDVGRPAEFVVAEGDAGERREKEPADAPADDALSFLPYFYKGDDDGGQ